MANAKKCDRCGKYYMDGEKTAHDADGYYIGGITTLSIKGNSITKYDLCDNCIKKLMIFLDNEEVAES